MKHKVFNLLLVNCFALVIFVNNVYANGEGHEAGEEHSVFDILIPLAGVLTIASLIATFILGWKMPDNRKILFPLHKRMAILTVVMAVIHASMVLLFH